MQPTELRVAGSFPTFKQLMKKNLILTITGLLIFCQQVVAEDLFNAIEMNDLPQVKSILQKDRQLINTTNAFGYTPLIAAVKDGRKIRLVG